MSRTVLMSLTCRLSRAHRLASLLASTALFQLAPAKAAELPKSPSVARGAVSVSTPSSDSMLLLQAGSTAILNWQSFSIGKGSRVDIRQPSTSSVMLNRVTGSTPSTIAGALNATGQVYLVNPNGILLTPTGTVNAGGGFVASTLDIADDDFIAGKRRFKGKGSSSAVSNRGSISIGQGGYAALIGGKVDNEGVLSVPLGKIGLGAGEQVTIDPSGDGFLQVAVPTVGLPPGEDLVLQAGRIGASGGSIEMKAATARNIARSAVNVTGLAEARSVGGRSGSIILDGGDGGKVAVSGSLSAKADRGSRNRGGSVVVTGREIALRGAILEASGDTGGGSVFVGGAAHGKSALRKAETTFVDRRSTIRTDAGSSGEGGTVVVWSDTATTFDGHISARGGSAGGNGGWAEVSSHGTLEFGGDVNLWGRASAFGTLLLDPLDIVIMNSSASTSGSTSIIDAAGLQRQLNSASVTLETNTPGTGTGNITLDAPLSWSQPTTLRLTAAADIILNQSVAASSGTLAVDAAGQIAANSAVDVGTFQLLRGTWREVGTLSSFAARNFNIAPGASFLRATRGSGSAVDPFEIADVYGLQGMGSYNLLSSNFRLARDIDASATADWSDRRGKGFVPVAESRLEQVFSGSLDGAGHQISGLFIERPDDLDVALFGDVAGTISNLRLVDVDVKGGDRVGALAGFVRSSGSSVVSVQATGSVAATGILSTTFWPDTDYVRAQTVSATAGGLIGENMGTVLNSRARVAVTANASLNADIYSHGLVDTTAGGFAGINRGSITRSRADGNVIASASGNGQAADLAMSVLAGGFIGDDDGGRLNQVAATGAVSATAGNRNTATSGSNETITYAGGLVARSTGSSIADAYAAGSVRGSLDPEASGRSELAVGGLVGLSTGDVITSYAAGEVVGSDAPADVQANIGGLVGRNSLGESIGSVSRSFWDTISTGQRFGVSQTRRGAFDATGLSPSQLGDTAGFLRVARAEGWDFEGTWAPGAQARRPALYAIDPVLFAPAGDSPLAREVGEANVLVSLADVGGGPSSYVFGPAGDSLPDSARVVDTRGTQAASGTYPSTTFSPTTVTSALGTLYSLLVDTQTLTVNGSQEPAPVPDPGQLPGPTTRPAGRETSGSNPTPLAALLQPEVDVGPILNGNDQALPGPFDVPDQLLGPLLNGGGNGGGPTLGTGQATTTLETARATLSYVERDLENLERKLADCERIVGKNSDGYAACVGDVMSSFAASIDERILELPEPLRGIPAVIREAAKRLRAAKTVAEARAAVRDALSAVRKAIALIRSDDPAVARTQIRQGAAIRTALERCDMTLALAGGI